MDRATRVQILDKTDCISHSPNTPWETYESNYSPSSYGVNSRWQTRFFSLGEATSLGEVKLRLKIDLVSYPVRAEELVNMIKYHYSCNNFFREPWPENYFLRLSSVYEIKCLELIYKQAMVASEIFSRTPMIQRVVRICDVSDCFVTQYRWPTKQMIPLSVLARNQTKGFWTWNLGVAGRGNGTREESWVGEKSWQVLVTGQQRGESAEDRGPAKKIESRCRHSSCLCGIFASNPC